MTTEQTNSLWGPEKGSFCWSGKKCKGERSSELSRRHVVGNEGAEVVEGSRDIRAEVGEGLDLHGPMENADVRSCDGSCYIQEDSTVHNHRWEPQILETRF
jgi:hypothetical protein